MLMVQICGEDCIIPDPAALVEDICRRGWSRDFIEQLKEDIQMLKALHSLEERGLIQMTQGIHTKRLLRDTEKLLRMLVAAEK